MTGDGDIDLRAVRAQVEAAGDGGHCEVEIPSAKAWWKRDPDEVLRVCIERHQKYV
jgi:sugar phosphate isomerase/epimerase